MTNISVTKTSYQTENRSWLASTHGTEPGANPSVTLDVSKFTAGTHYPNGYIPSGMVLGKVTATGLYGPYDNAAADGRQTAAGHLLASLSVGTLTKIGGALLVHGFVTEAKLPTNHGLDAAGKAELPGIYYR